VRERCCSADANRLGANVTSRYARAMRRESSNANINAEVHAQGLDDS
jgi:hypothetical protein